MANWYSAALCRGLIEAWLEHAYALKVARGIPRLYAAASLKPAGRRRGRDQRRQRIPRLYAAASLKHGHHPGRAQGATRAYSAALCRGLIEAAAASPPAPAAPPYSAALCRGLILNQAMDSRLRGND